MVVAFYYHYPVYIHENRKFIPGFLGCFLHALSLCVDKLIVVAHPSTVNKNNLFDYELKDDNMEFIFIKERTAAWHRHLFHRSILKSLKSKLHEVDFLIVRSPSPLAPFFADFVSQTKLVYMIVGDYRESIEQMPSRGFRNKIMRMYIRHNDSLFRKAMKHADLLVNSPSLYEKYKHLGQSIHQIRTTTLSKNDIYVREDTCLNSTIQILYTGRLDWAKGLNEMAEAFIQLRQQGESMEWHLVGWEEAEEKPVEKSLRLKVTEAGMQEFIFFHGKKKLGMELNNMYRMADIYVLPSYHEGFPRTIWEAMANGLPVITTSVGAIPLYLEHEQHALLMQPKSVSEIVQAVLKLKRDKTLRKRLINNGYIKAKENTLEIQTKNMINILTTLS